MFKQEYSIIKEWGTGRLGAWIIGKTRGLDHSDQEKVKTAYDPL